MAAAGVGMSSICSPSCAATWLRISRAGEQQLLPTLGWGNRLTLLRGILVAGLVGFLVLPAARRMDRLGSGDPVHAFRRGRFLRWLRSAVTRHATRLGEILDMSFDGVGVLAAAWLGVAYGQLPLWYISIGLARYLFLAGSWLRRRMGKPLYDMPPSVMRRVLAGFQMGFLAVVLWPLLGPPATVIAAYYFGVPFLVGFLRDWLYVSGVLQPGRATPGWLQALVARWLPLILRLALVALSLLLQAPIYRNFDSLGLFRLFCCCSKP